MTQFLQIWLMPIRALRLMEYFSAAQVAAMVSLVLFSATVGKAQEAPMYLTDVNGILFFTASSPENSRDLWRSDGTAQGTYMVKDIKPGTQDAGIIDLTNVNGMLYFSANVTGSNTIYGSELWKSNGTAEGTVLVKDFNTVSPNSILRHLTNVNGTLYFYLEKNLGEYQLWKSNGTEAGTVMLKSFTAPPPEQFQLSAVDHLRLVNGNGTLYFTAEDTTYGWELWKSNGTSAGTVLVKDIRPGVGGSVPGDLFYWKDALYFAAEGEGLIGRELWKSDGTAQGTVLLKDISPEQPIRFGGFIPGHSNPAGFTPMNGLLFFSASDATDRFSDSDNRELWKTDGTAEGTSMVADIKPGGSYPTELTNVNGTLFFRLQESAFGSTYSNELWKSDGTAQGTMKVTEIGFGEGNTRAYLTSLNGILYFKAAGEGFNYELWKSNGTAEGTVQVKDIHPEGAFGYNASDPAELTVVNNTLFFTAFDGTTTSRELWKSDGTEAGTVKVKSANSTTNCSATGTISREYWSGIPGTALSAIPFNTTPATSTQLTSFEAPTNVGDNYGQRIRGYICAPLTGQYYFAIASDDNSELWLSTDENPANKQKIASVSGWTNPREWNKYPSQFSGAINLQAGKKYYIEARHKEGAGGDNLAVAWTTPGSSLTVISGAFLSPFVPEPACTASGSILREYWANISGTAVSAIPLNTVPTSTSQLTSFEAPSYVGENYGQRIRGYICAPVTGNYIFYIAGDDDSELWLSTSENPANRQKIASVSGWAYPREWTKYPSQTSVSIALQAGKKYYIEALHKESIKGDNLAVGWIKPNTSAIEVIPGTVLSPFVPEPMCTASGSILREYWASVSGTIANIPVNTAPTSTSQLISFEAPSNVGDNYGQRIRGYICAPVTGNYTFYIASDDDGQLWLSTDENPLNKQKIASVSGWTYSREWNKYASQKSVSIALQAGQKYYIEALHKDGAGGDRLAIGWTLPNTSAIEVIPGSVLSPYMPANAARIASVEVANVFGLQVFPNPSSGEGLKVTIEGQRGKQAVKLSLYSSMGIRVFSLEAETDEAGMLTKELSIPEKLSTGIYVLKAESGNQTAIQRIVIHQ